jgi:hypothetical protein
MEPNDVGQPGDTKGKGEACDTTIGCRAWVRDHEERKYEQAPTTQLVDPDFKGLIEIPDSKKEKETVGE